MHSNVVRIDAIRMLIRASLCERCAKISGFLEFMQGMLQAYPGRRQISAGRGDVRMAQPVAHLMIRSRRCGSAWAGNRSSSSPSSLRVLGVSTLPSSLITGTPCSENGVRSTWPSVIAHRNRCRRGANGGFGPAPALLTPGPVRDPFASDVFHVGLHDRRDGLRVQRDLGHVPGWDLRSLQCVDVILHHTLGIDLSRSCPHVSFDIQFGHVAKRQAD